MLNMLNSGGPVESKCASFRGNVEYVECFGESLGTPPVSSKKIQHIQHVHWKKHIFSKNASFRGNVEYVEYWGACWIKMCFFLQKCWICWICWMFWGKNGDTPPSSKKIQHIQHFAWKKRIFSKETSFSWNVKYVEFSGQGSPSNFPQNIQHVQHVQHFCRKKHIWFNMGPRNSTYSTFRLEERHFSKNVLLSSEMLNMLNSLARGHLLISPKTFNIFNISSESSTFWFNMGPRIQHIQHFPGKKHFFEKMCFLQGNCWICWIFSAMYVWMGDVQNENLVIEYTRDIKREGCLVSPNLGTLGKPVFYYKTPCKNAFLAFLKATDEAVAIYIYAVGRESGPLEVVIWSPKRFPLQNRAF